MEEVNKQSRKIDYKNSKIFILEPKTQHPEEDIFYSSTTQPIFKRLSQFKKDNLKKNTSYKWLFDKYGIDNIKIVLIKSFSCNNKEELEAEEAKYIRENDCINKMINLNKQKTKEDKQEIKEEKEIKEEDKQEIKEDKQEIKEDKQEIKEDKREIKEEDKHEINFFLSKVIKEIKEENKEIKEENKTKKSRDKEYYNKNKENILKKRREQRQEKNKQQEEEILLLKGKTS
jgi:flagellar biosynthesis GTPase FlhF